MIIRNLIVKLRKGNNNYYVELVKDISSFFRNEFGIINYLLLVDMFGLVGDIIVLNYGKEERLDFGINEKVFDIVERYYKGFLVNKVSYGVRSLRYF